MQRRTIPRLSDEMPGGMRSFLLRLDLNYKRGGDEMAGCSAGTGHGVLPDRSRNGAKMVDFVLAIVLMPTVLLSMLILILTLLRPRLPWRRRILFLSKVHAVTPRRVLSKVEAIRRQPKRLQKSIAQLNTHPEDQP